MIVGNAITYEPRVPSPFAATRRLFSQIELKARFVRERVKTKACLCLERRKETMSAKIAHGVELNRAEVPTRPPAGPFKA